MIFICTSSLLCVFLADSPCRPAIGERDFSNGGSDAGTMRLQQRDARRQQQQPQKVTAILGSNPSSPSKRKTKSRSRNILMVLQSALLLCIAVAVLVPAVFHPQFIWQDRHYLDIQYSSSSNRSNYSELDSFGNFPPPPKQHRTRTQQQDDQKRSITTTSTSSTASTETMATSSNQELHQQQQQQLTQQQHHSYCHYHDYHNFNYRYPMYSLEEPNDTPLSSAMPLPLPPTARWRGSCMRSRRPRTARAALNGSLIASPARSSTAPSAQVGTAAGHLGRWPSHRPTPTSCAARTNIWPWLPRDSSYRPPEKRQY